MAEAFFSRLAQEGISSQQLFARIMQDQEAFEHAVLIRKLHELIPELNAFDVATRQKMVVTDEAMKLILKREASA